MKKLSYHSLLLLTIVCLTGCTQKQTPKTEMLPEQIAETIVESQTQLPAMNRTGGTEKDFLLWLSDYYLIGDDQVEDGIIFYGEGVEAAEIAVLQLADEKNGKAVEAALTAYKESRAGVFEGYAPLQAALVKEGEVMINGPYGVLLICQDVPAAKAAFLGCFEKTSEASGKDMQTFDTQVSEAEFLNDVNAQEDGQTEETENAVNAEYDPAAVLQAWKKGDMSALSDRNRQILEAAQKVIAQEIKESMNEYEKELAIHDWITGWCRFDYGVFDRSSSDGFTDGSNTPYGVLIDRSAMCHGYSSTFQLFMDMLDIECITVFGLPNGNGVEHSWNMVKLDGEWYCVDTAWDDPIGGNPGHTYFNVTSDYLRSGSIHRWDDNSVPEAEGTVYGYQTAGGRS